MQIKKLLSLIIVFICSTVHLYAQQAVADIRGEWQIVKAETRLYGQEDTTLIEKKTLTTADDIRTINGSVPINLVFNDPECIIITQGYRETGTYTLQGDRLLYRNPAFAMQVNSQEGMPQPEIPAIPYKYAIKGTDAMILELPASFYKDGKTGLAVKLVCTCYYSKKK